MTITDELRDQLCAWLTANGIDPKNVPTDARMSWVDGRLTTDMHLLDEDGRKHEDPTRKNQLARETKTFPASQPPPLVATWLLPRCPTCGR
jgi:hypothetical protein